MLEHASSVLLLLQLLLCKSDLKHTSLQSHIEHSFKYAGITCTVWYSKIIAVFILLKSVFPFLLLSRCPLSEAGRTTWTLSLSTAEALEGLRILSPQVDPLMSVETHTYMGNTNTHIHFSARTTWACIIVFKLALMFSKALHLEMRSFLLSFPQCSTAQRIWVLKVNWQCLSMDNIAGF